MIISWFLKNYKKYKYQEINLEKIYKLPTTNYSTLLRETWEELNKGRNILIDWNTQYN